MVCVYREIVWYHFQYGLWVGKIAHRIKVKLSFISQIQNIFQFCPFRGYFVLYFGSTIRKRLELLALMAFWIIKLQFNSTGYQMYETIYTDILIDVRNYNQIPFLTNNFFQRPHARASIEIKERCSSITLTLHVRTCLERWDLLPRPPSSTFYPVLRLQPLLHWHLQQSAWNMF